MVRASHGIATRSVIWLRTPLWTSRDLPIPAPEPPGGQTHLISNKCLYSWDGARLSPAQSILLTTQIQECSPKMRLAGATTPCTQWWSAVGEYNSGSQTYVSASRGCGVFPVRLDVYYLPTKSQPSRTTFKDLLQPPIMPTRRSESWSQRQIRMTTFTDKRSVDGHRIPSSYLGGGSRPTSIQWGAFWFL